MVKTVNFILCVFFYNCKKKKKRDFHINSMIGLSYNLVTVVEPTYS